jgi:hypothetical protein
MAHFVQNIGLKTAGECFGDVRRMQTNFTAQRIPESQAHRRSRAYQEADP